MSDVANVAVGVLNDVRSAWRFRWHGLAAAWALCLVGWLVVAAMPDVYEAHADVYVDTSSVLKPLLTNQIVNPDVMAQLTYTRQALLSREHLERIAKDNGLAQAASTPTELNGVLGRLLKAINMETRPLPNQPGSIVAAITYRNASRDKAIGVVETLLTSLVEGTLGATKERTNTAERFLDERIAEYENRLEKAERALADFKKANANRLPGAEGGYFAQINAERAALEAVRRNVRVAESKSSQIKAQLNSSVPVMPTATAGRDLPPNSIDARIRDYRAQLDKLLLNFTDKHPDVIAVREALGQLERQRADQLRAMGVVDANQEISGLESNPVHQALQIALNETQVEIATLQAEVEERSQKLRGLQGLVDEVPEVEAELARLNRDYEIIYQQYQALTRSRETQDLSEKAADSDEAKFKVLNPPHADFEPVAPKRPLFYAGIFVFALLVGGGVCWLLAAVSPVFTSAAILRAVVGLPVIGVVGEALQGPKRAQRRVALAAFGGACGLLAALLMLAVLYEMRGAGLHSLVSAV